MAGRQFEYLFLREADEVGRRYRSRVLLRRLRDSSNPFELDERTFVKLFRLSRQLAYDLFLQIRDHLNPPIRKTQIPAHIKMFVALNFFGHGSYQTCVGRNYNFAVSQPSVSRILKQVSGVLVNNLLNINIVFPTTRDTISKNKQRFAEKFRFPNVIGCIDCTHVSIVSPAKEDPNEPAMIFMNRKGFHSLNVQVICDANLFILNVNARYPGSTHDAAIWTMSNIKQNLLNRFLRGERNTWLLGDSGYPLQPWLLTPILNPAEGSPEARYNAAHIRTRNCVERCIGVLKGRFRCLLKDRVLHYAPTQAGRIIYSCAILHNMCIKHNMPVEEEWHDMDNNINNNNNNVDNNLPANLLLLGVNTRRTLIQQNFI